MLMHNYLKNAVITIDQKKYLSLLIILAPLLNFLSGVSFDLHAPSLPAIASYYGAPISAAKNTITLTLLGFAIGCLVFGTLLDIFGRRSIILIALLIYTIASFSAPFCTNIHQLLWIRFIQGFSVSCVTIGCRAIIIDMFSGHEFRVAMLYTSLAFGIGPILAPFFGGFIQQHLGWKANFIGYGIISSILLIIFALYIQESKHISKPFSFKNLLESYVSVLRHYAFWPGLLITGFIQVLIFAYTVFGAFLIEDNLHYSAITYGNTALAISCGYFFGTITNRFLIKNFPIYKLINFGFLLLFSSLLLQIIFSTLGEMNLFTIILPITLISYSNAFIFINVFTACLSNSKSAAIATALYSSGTLVIGTIGTKIISHINVSNLFDIAAIYYIPSILAFIVFVLFFRKIAKTFI